ncbi:hypothetical protein GmRootA79_33750 [Acidovorax sp. A79]
MGKYSASHWPGAQLACAIALPPASIQEAANSRSRVPAWRDRMRQERAARSLAAGRWGMVKFLLEDKAKGKRKQKRRAAERCDS